MEINATLQCENYAKHTGQCVTSVTVSRLTALLYLHEQEHAEVWATIELLMMESCGHAPLNVDVEQNQMRKRRARTAVNPLPLEDPSTKE